MNVYKKRISVPHFMKGKKASPAFAGASTRELRISSSTLKTANWNQEPQYEAVRIIYCLNIKSLK
jgi:hypothetical protein